MRIMLCVLAEGRGHLTQAIAVKERLEEAGHLVVSVVLGAGRNRRVPPFFVSAIKMPIERIPTLEFAYKDDRRVSLPATLARLAKRIPAYALGLRRLHGLVRETEPDVILNFFEPLTAIYALTRRRRPPVIAIAHQFMYEHPNYIRAPGKRFQQLAMKWYVRLVGGGSRRLALSLYEAPDLPERKLRVSPPLLRRRLFELKTEPDGRFVLVYLLSHGYAEQIIAWHQQNPETVLHCFYDKPEAPPELRYDETLTFHRLDGEKFLRMMAGCRQVVCTAGFESLCEAAYLGKPLFLVPVENHIEQEINAIDATRIGWGVRDGRFNLDRLSELPDYLANAEFRGWLGRADAILLQTLEAAVAPVWVKPRGYRPWESGSPKAA